MGGDQTLSEAFKADANFEGRTSGNFFNGDGYDNDILSSSGSATTLAITGAAGSSGRGLPLAQTAGSQAVPGIDGLAARSRRPCAFSVG
ncbi:MAG: hypothetical protein CMJ23_08625 [Phycisphaerae bacterium]|nr:hypothetical protein [Phycisphaerae bacterium]